MIITGYPRSIHVLKGIHKTATFGLNHQGKPFVIGFVLPQEAVYATRQITLDSAIRFKQFQPRDVTDIVQQGLEEQGIASRLGRIRVDENAILLVQKKESIQFDWILEQSDFTTFLAHPFARQTGIIMVKRRLVETAEDIQYSVEVIEPSFEALAFQNNLEKLY